MDETPTPTLTSASAGPTASTWGIDLAAPTALLAQRGFEGLVCNDVADLGQWRLGEGTAVLHLADGALSTLRQLERVGDEPVVVGVAVPGWLGSLGRCDLVGRLVPGELAGEAGVSLTCVSSATCLAVGSNRAAVHGGAVPVDETVLAVDAELGWGAGVVRISADEVVEVASAAVSPGSTVDRDGLLGALLAATATTTDVGPVDRVVVIGPPGEEALVAASLERLLDATRPPIVVVATRRTTAAGALVLASPAADRDAGGSLLSGRAASTGEPWRLVQSALRVSGASLGAVAGHDEIDVVVGDSAPPTAVGEHQGADMAAAVVALASASVTVATAGLGSTAPTGLQSDGHGIDEFDAINEFDAIDAIDGIEDAPSPEHAAEPRPLPTGSCGDDGAAGVSAALADALVRCERLLSYEVGAQVAVRSVPALVGCDDHADVDELVSAAAGLREVAGHRGDELGGALLDAIDVGMARVLADPEHRYVAGTMADVTTEVERVVEHLRVVVGVVAPAERARIVRDAALLGPDPTSAAALVAEVVGSQPAGLDVPPNGRADEPGYRRAAAVWRPSDGRFVLADPAPVGPASVDPVLQRTVAIRVLIER